MESLKDYERLYQACKILDKYVKDGGEYNLNPDHDIIFLCFDVDEDVINSNDLDRLDELGCRKNTEYYPHWYMYISC